MHKRYQGDCAPFQKELAAAGFPTRGFDSVPYRGEKHPPQVVNLILKWVGKLSEPNVIDILVRHLICAEKSFAADPLLRLFEQTDSSSLRWSIANTIASARIECDPDWIVSALDNRSFGHSREMLILAFERLARREEANEYLLPLFSQFPGHVAMALAKSGGENELAFFSNQATEYKGWVKRAIAKAINKIKKRLELEVTRSK